MAASFERTRDWRRTKLFTSIDGVAKHDVQRHVKGAFDKSMGNLARLKEAFPALDIDVKFTITPVNYMEILDAFRHCTQRGLNFTVKMVENNPHYTNVLSHQAHGEDFAFSASQTEAVRSQLEAMLAEGAKLLSADRRREVREVLESLAPAWCRSGRCLTPRQGAFLDSHLNFFTCKEYAPVLNLATQTLDDLVHCPSYWSIAAAERENGASCTRCTSQLKIAPPLALFR
jgi:MoaA/NifB/PqqE/SkfB family radical SAM enzyme